MKDRALTTRFDMQTMAEFAVAVDILGARSINALVHQMVKEKIREAKAQVSEKEFISLVEAQKEKSEARSLHTKQRGQLEIVGELAQKSAVKTPVIKEKSAKKVA